MNTTRLLLALTLTLAASLCVTAQPAPVIVNARLVCLSLTGEPVSDLVLKGVNRTLTLNAPVDYLSDPVDYRGPAQLALYAKTQPPADPAKPAAPPVPLALVDLPPTGGEFLLIFGGKPGELRVAALDWTGQTAPLGSYTFWNLSQRPLGVVLGETNQMLPAGLRSLLRPQTTDRSYLPLRVFDEHAGAARQLFASRHFHRETTRQLVFITDVAGTDRVKLKIITQRIFAPLQPSAPVVASAGR